jgi:hypothetical protein
LVARRRRNFGPNPRLRGSRRNRSGPLCAIAISLLIAMLGAAAPAGANCDEDCNGELVSALRDCRSQYEQGGEDLSGLEDCLADTRNEYDDCVDECTSIGAGGVVACSSPAGLSTVVSLRVRWPGPNRHLRHPS